MATWTKGVVVWIGDNGSPPGQLSKGLFRDVTDAAALTALVHKTTGIGQFTDCNIYAEHFNSVIESGSGHPGVDACVDIKAQIILKDTSDGSITKFMIPAPKSTMFEFTDQGERVTAAALATIVGLVNTATGKTFVALYGTKLQKS